MQRNKINIEKLFIKLFYAKYIKAKAKIKNSFNKDLKEIQELNKKFSL